MVTLSTHYPKLLAFLQVIYPSLFEKLTHISRKSDLVEATLISSNNLTSYQAIVFSEGNTNNGEIFKIIPKNNFVMPYSWDWRWVFALHVMYEDNTIFSIKFQQKVIALPTGKHPLSGVFFRHLSDEFSVQIQKLIAISNQNKILIAKAYDSYIDSLHI